MVSAVAAMALLSGLPNLGALLSPNHDQTVERSRVMGWSLEVVQDRFANTTTCRLQKSAMQYRHGVVTFQFGGGVNTAGAQFRVDGGEAKTAVSVAGEAAGLGARLSGDNLRNPSDGAVHIPASMLAGARTVAIRPDSLSNHRDFSLAGLSEALQAAKEKNCDVV